MRRHWLQIEHSAQLLEINGWPALAYAIRTATRQPPVPQESEAFNRALVAELDRLGVPDARGVPPRA